MKEMYEMACYNALNAVSLLEASCFLNFKKHKSDSKRCEKLFDALTSYTFIRVVYTMMDAIPSLAASNMVFQKQDLDIAAVQPAIDGFFSAVDGTSTGKSYYQRELKSLLKKCDGNTVKLKDVKLDLDHKTVAELDKAFANDVRIYSFGILRRFQHCTGHITTGSWKGSWKGRGNQYIEFVRVLYCKLPTNGKQLLAFPLEAVP